MGDKIEQRLKEEKVIRYSEFNEQDEYCKKHNTPKGSGSLPVLARTRNIALTLCATLLPDS